MPEATELEKLTIERAAKNRYQASDATSKSLQNAYERYIHYYDPLNGDQWPEDKEQRPNKIHITLNIVKAAVDIASRLQGIRPRLALRPPNPTDPNQRAVSEALEKVHKNWLDDSGWELWLTDTSKVKEIYGKTVLKPYWDDELDQPSVVALEQPGKLRIGWSGSDYRKKDWTIFEYRLSPLEAMTRWENLRISPTKGKDTPLGVRTTDHTDPLDTIPSGGFTGLSPGGGLNPLLDDEFEAKDFEGKTVAVWDYWYKKLDDERRVKVCNAILVDGVLVDGPHEHNEYPDLPYIVVENDHRPGSPEGISSVKSIMDLQDEFNRHFSHWAQMVADNSDPAWQLTGENATEVTAGMIPKAGEVSPTGTNNRIEPVNTSFNQFPLQQLVTEYWQAFHRITGLAEILFGALPGSQTSGRAVAVQIEAASNRLVPRRDRLYYGLKEVFRFWKFMLKQKNATATFLAVDEETGEEEERTIRISELLDNAGSWDVVAPEITPRDVIEHTTNVINKLNSKMTSVRRGLDDLGEDSPEDIIREITEERNNVDLFPGDVQIKAAVLNLLWQLQVQQAAMGATAEMQGQAPGENPAGTEADGGEGAAQPMSQPGVSGGGPPVSQQTLIRSQPNGQAQALQQAAIRPE